VTKKTLSKTLDNGMDSIFKSMDSVFEKMTDLFEDVDFEESAETEDPKCSSYTTQSDDGVIRITNNNGHVVIDGNLRSLKVNDVDVSALMVNPLK
jgi:hypothetical protein